MWLGSPAAIMGVWMMGTPAQRLGLVLFLGGAALVFVSCLMHVTRAFATPRRR